MTIELLFASFLVSYLATEVLKGRLSKKKK